MIWVYRVTESNELQAQDADSVQELQGFSKEMDWFWADFMDPTDEEFKVINELLGRAEIIQGIREQKMFSRPERVGQYLFFSIPYSIFKDKLQMFPIYVFMKDGTFFTVRGKNSSFFVRNAMKTFEDCVGKVCNGSINSSFILSRLFHEISNTNLDVIMALRESIDRTEQKALENPADKKISKSIFSIKRSVSALERVLWSQRELMLNIKEGVVPMIQTSQEIRETLDHPINNISRELYLLDSHNSALDSILNLQDLGLIHRVERNIIYLTIMALVVSVLLILLEIDIISLLSR